MIVDRCDVVMAPRRSANMNPSISGMFASSRMSWNGSAAAPMAARASAPPPTAVGRISPMPVGVVVIDDQHPQAIERGGRARGRRRRLGHSKECVELKHTAAAHFTLDRDDATHPGHELRADGQPETRATVQPGARAVRLGEGLEDPRLLLGRDPDAGIADGEAQARVVP